LVRDFIVFEDDGSGRLVKKMAGYHQFYAVRVAVEETLRAAAPVLRASPAARPATGASAWSGTRRAAARV